MQIDTVSIHRITEESKEYALCLTILGGKTVDEAVAALSKIRAALGGAAQLDAARVAAPAAQAKDPLSDGEIKELVDGELEAQRKARGTTQAPKPGKKKPEPEPEPEEEEEPEEEPEEEDEDEDEEPEPAVKVKLTKELKAATKLREVVEILIGQGIRSKKQLVLTCTKLKDAVPVLGKIADLESRVAKAAELVDSSIS